MKKIILELVITASLVITVLFSGMVVKNSVYAVDVYKITPTKVEDTVVCSGKVQYKETCEVNPTTAGVIKNVKVEKGEYVKKDQVLFSMITDLSSSSVNLNGALSEVVDKKTINVVAPISGTVLDVAVKADDTVANNLDAVTIVNSKDLCVSVPVSESKIANVEVGQEVEITGTAFDGNKYSGVVLEVDNVAKQVVTTTGKETAVNVTVSIDNPDEKIKQGYTAKCTIVTNVKDNDIIVPYEAIEMTDEKEGIVYMYSNGKAVKKTVQIGNEYENGVEVLSGLKNSDLIINSPEQISNKNSIKINKLLENEND
ncbi:MAG: efflux RND transporter periplasmic adaptor subunit [Acutalibacteraceae bacterium]|nr:efflux RND transporter periplasmic adaptor subunit [Acutalibacteraceae bacterium]